jgi:hypothetical protein
LPPTRPPARISAKPCGEGKQVFDYGDSFVQPRQNIGTVCHGHDSQLTFRDVGQCLFDECHEFEKDFGVKIVVYEGARRSSTNLVRDSKVKISEPDVLTDAGGVDSNFAEMALMLSSNLRVAGSPTDRNASSFRASVSAALIAGRKTKNVPGAKL